MPDNLSQIIECLLFVAGEPLSAKELARTTETDVDAVYLRNQRAAHDAALALHRTYSTSGDTDSLKKAAGEIVPVVEQHIAELGKLTAATETTDAR